MWDQAVLSWANFRSKVLGATTPEEACAGSLRGEILARWVELGLRSPLSGSDNGVLASASPFEGLCERVTWLGAGFSTLGIYLTSY